MSEERQKIDIDTPWWGEHLFRYNLAKKSVKENFKILDIACGNGYGTMILAKNINSCVVGADISFNVVNECKSRFSLDNLSFLQTNVVKTPFPSNYFDLIVSFETIEHTKEYKSMLIELKRILKPNGLLLLSTPNKLISSPDGIIFNPYHTQEWSLTELQILLSCYFINIKIYGQVFKRYKGKPHFIENLLYTKGIRKLPIWFKNKIMQIINKPGLYPKDFEFELTDAVDKINTSPTFICYCYK